MIERPSPKSADFLNQLAFQLRKKLVGAYLVECFSQNKDELVFGFGLPNEDVYIIADLQPAAGLLYFPKEYHRAKKNSVDLFPELKNAKVIEILPILGDRSFVMVFELGYGLLFKMYGRNANIVLFKENEVVAIFKNNIRSDFECQWPDVPPFEENILIKGVDFINLANEFYEDFRRNYYFNAEKSAFLKILTEKIKKTQNYLSKVKTEIENFESGQRFEEWANILMANVHLKVANEKSVTLFDFYNNTETEIKLNPTLSLQKNAENYYRKSKNRKIEYDKLLQNDSQKEKELNAWQSKLQELEGINDFKVLRQWGKVNKIEIKTDVQAQQELPFKIFEIEGFQVLIGKNAQNNDLLTLKYAHKEDLWLHAKDVSGSHVVVKYQAGKTFPKTVVETAASLAAYFSKRKTDTLAPVTVTPKKYVRKPKGLLPGQVVVDREMVVLVEPKVL